MLQKEALDIMKMGYNVYLTGEAGTGKTYVLIKYLNFLKDKQIPTAITASTGIAATHLDGVTIDSWSGLGIRESISSDDLKLLKTKYHLVKRLRRAKILVIDEISMIHGLRFDAIDRILRNIRDDSAPFGGLQVILSGDLFQLPPVTYDKQNIDFIFKSTAWQDLNLRICYLHEPKRHNKDHELLTILNQIRHNQVNNEVLVLLNNIMEKSDNRSYFQTKLYTHNVDVDNINQIELDKISNEPHIHYMVAVGNESLTDMMKRTCLAPEKLELKKGAFVMFVKNNYNKGYVNGTLGRVISFDKNDDPIVESLSKKRITVEPESWTITDDNKIIAQITQIPLRLAWAITVHKSQGMTLDSAEIDLSRSFIEGMGYVALSRVKSLKGLRLLGINQMALRVNPEVSEFDRHLDKLSIETARNLKKMGWIGRYIKKCKYMYKLTSSK